MRNEPQHDHASATIKTKMHVLLIGFSHSQINMPFVIMNVAVRKLTNPHEPNLRARPTSFDVLFAPITSCNDVAWRELWVTKNSIIGNDATGTMTDSSCES